MLATLVVALALPYLIPDPRPRNQLIYFRLNDLAVESFLQETDANVRVLQSASENGNTGDLTYRNTYHNELTIHYRSSTPEELFSRVADYTHGLIRSKLPVVEEHTGSDAFWIHARDQNCSYFIGATPSTPTAQQQDIARARSLKVFNIKISVHGVQTDS